jgi:hypothetical protein
MKKMICLSATRQALRRNHVMVCPRNDFIEGAGRHH